MDWLKISSAIFIILLLVFLLPRAKDMMKNSPKAESGDWQAAFIPLLGVLGFIILLVWIVQQ